MPFNEKSSNNTNQLSSELQTIQSSVPTQNKQPFLHELPNASISQKEGHSLNKLPFHFWLRKPRISNNDARSFGTYFVILWVYYWFLIWVLLLERKIIPKIQVIPQEDDNTQTAYKELVQEMQLLQKCRPPNTIQTTAQDQQQNFEAKQYNQQNEPKSYLKRRWSTINSDETECEANDFEHHSSGIITSYKQQQNMQDSRTAVILSLTPAQIRRERLFWPSPEQYSSFTLQNPHLPFCVNKPIIKKLPPKVTMENFFECIGYQVLAANDVYCEIMGYSLVT